MKRRSVISAIAALSFVVALIVLIFGIFIASIKARRTPSHLNKSSDGSNLSLNFTDQKGL